MTSIWAPGPVNEAELNTRIRDPLDLLMNPPACRRAAKPTGTIARNTWSVLRLEPPGQGAGKAHSYDSTGSLMSGSPVAVTAPIDGLYEVNGGVLLAAPPGGRLGYARVALAKGAADPAAFDAIAVVKWGLNRIGAAYRSGAGTATIPLRAGEWVALAAWADADWTAAAAAENSTSTTFLEILRVGDLP